MLLTALLAFVAGALVMYGFLWYQVYQRFDKAWCQIYTGALSVEQSQHCAIIKEQAN